MNRSQRRKITNDYHKQVIDTLWREAHSCLDDMLALRTGQTDEQLSAERIEHECMCRVITMSSIVLAIADAHNKKTSVLDELREKMKKYPEMLTRLEIMTAPTLRIVPK